MNEPLRIVVADDEPDIREFLQKFLVRLGHVVGGAARDGDELVAMCRAVQPDLVMTDIRMPVLDGIEAATQIYRERPTAIVLISAQFNSELIARAEAGPIQSYLVKPIAPADLEPTIAVAVSRFRQLRALQEALAQAQRLQRLLPICCYCKKVRDDQNYWQQVEEYISAHSSTRFSHGICPDCYERVVKPDLAAP